MATMYFRETVPVPAEQAWKVIADYVTADSHLFTAAASARIEEVAESAPGRPAGTYRVVTTADGEHDHWELLIGTNEEHMRASYTVPGLFGADHHSAAMEVVPVDAQSCDVVWVTDVLPDSFAEEFTPFYVDNFADILKAVQGKLELP